MYKLIFIISLIIRQFCLPNPFECFGDKALVYNWIAGLVLAAEVIKDLIKKIFY